MEKIIDIFIYKKDFRRFTEFSDFIENIGDICHNELIILTNKKIYVFYADSNEQGGDVRLEKDGENIKDLIGQNLIEIKEKKYKSWEDKYVFWEIKTSKKQK